MVGYLDIPIAVGEPDQDGDEAHDETGYAEDHTPLDPVEFQDTGTGIQTGLTARGTGQAHIG